MVDDEKEGELELPKLKLDALKAIRESAFQRYEKRRSYEWRFSICIWTALAAFSGLALNKDFSLLRSTSIAAGFSVAGALIACLQYRHLRSMFRHTIGDASLQRFAESEMYKLAYNKDLPQYDPRENKNQHLFHPPLGFYALLQVVITVILVIGAAVCIIATTGHKRDSDSGQHYSSLRGHFVFEQSSGNRPCEQRHRNGAARCGAEPQKRDKSTA